MNKYRYFISGIASINGKEIPFGEIVLLDARISGPVTLEKARKKTREVIDEQYQTTSLVTITNFIRL